MLPVYFYAECPHAGDIQHINKNKSLRINDTKQKGIMTYAECCLFIVMLCRQAKDIQHINKNTSVRINDTQQKGTQHNDTR